MDIDVALVGEAADEVDRFFGTEERVARWEDKAGDLGEELGTDEVKPGNELGPSLHLAGEDLFKTRPLDGLLIEELDGDLVWPVVGGVHGYSDGLMRRGTHGSWAFSGGVGWAAARCQHS